MQKPQHTLEEEHGAVVGFLGNRTAVCRFNHFEVPAGELVRKEFINSHQSLAQTVLLHQIVHLLFGFAQTQRKPRYSLAVCSRSLYVSGLQAFEHTEAVPYLVAEVPALFAQRIIVEYIVPRRSRKQYTHSYTVCAITLNQVQWVG